MRPLPPLEPRKAGEEALDAEVDEGDDDLGVVVLGGAGDDDAANRLKTATIGGTATTYAYNGDGVRVQKQVQGPDTDYVVDTNRSLPVVLHDGSAYYLYGLDLIARITTGGPAADRQRYYHYDGLGSTRAVTDANGNTDATYNYDVFGAIRSQTGSITNDFQYTGEQRDGESQYYFLRARYYDPATGRFVSRDPWAGRGNAPSTTHRYAYATNNPVNLVDPSGEAAFPPKKEPARYFYRDCTEGGSEDFEEDTCGAGGRSGGGAAAVPGGRVKFGQSSVSSTFQEGGPLGGRTIGDVAQGLRAGQIKPFELPIEYVIRNGQAVTLNNRSLLAFRRAGMEPTVLINRTGVPQYEAQLSRQLGGGAPSDTIRVRGGPPGTSVID